MPRFFVCDVSYQPVLAPGAVPGKRFKMRHMEGLLQETAMHLRRPDQAAGGAPDDAACDRHIVNPRAWLACYGV